MRASEKKATKGRTSRFVGDLLADGVVDCMPLAGGTAGEPLSEWLVELVCRCAVLAKKFAEDGPRSRAWAWLKRPQSCGVAGEVNFPTEKARLEGSARFVANISESSYLEEEASSINGSALTGRHRGGFIHDGFVL